MHVKSVLSSAPTSEGIGRNREPGSGGEFVAEPDDGEDELRIPRIFLELRPQPGHVRVDGVTSYPHTSLESYGFPPRVFRSLAAASEAVMMS